MQNADYSILHFLYIFSHKTGHSIAGGGDMILSYMRTVVLYAALILAIRLMGKRQIGQMEPSEFVVTMLVANLAAIPMQDE